MARLTQDPAPIDPHRATGPRNGDLPAYVANGVIGLRVREQPLMAGVAIVSGAAGVHPQTRIEASLPVPYPLAGDLAADGVWLSDQPWSVSNLEQTYSFRYGELATRFTFTAGEVGLEVEVLTFASRTAPSLALQAVEVRATRNCELRFRAKVETSGLRGAVTRRRTTTPGEADAVCDGAMLWTPEGEVSHLGVALHTGCSAQDYTRNTRPWDLSGPLVTDYAAQVRKGGSRRLPSDCSPGPVAPARPPGRRMRPTLGARPEDGL